MANNDERLDYLGNALAEAEELNLMLDEDNKRLETANRELEEKAGFIELEKEELEKKWQQALNDNAILARSEELQARCDNLDKEVAEYERLCKNYVKELELKDKQLLFAKAAEDYHYNVQSYRQQMNLNRQYQKENNVLRKEIIALRARTPEEKEAAQKELVRARIEVETSKRELANALEKVDVYTVVFNDIIFPEFKSRFSVLENEDANSINPVKLGNAVKASKKYDAQYEKQTKDFLKSSRKGKEVAEPTVDDKSYSNIISQATENFDDYISKFSKTEIGKKKVDAFYKRIGNVKTSEEAIEKVIEEQSKWNVKSIAKTKRGVATLIGVGALILTGALAAGILGPQLGKTEKKYENQVNTTGIVQTIGNISSSVAAEKTNLENGYNAIISNYENANTVNDIFKTEGVKDVAYSLTKREVDEVDLANGYSQVSTAKTNAENIISYTSAGTIDPTCTYATTVAAFDNAVSEKNIEKANEYSDAISELSNEIASYTQSSSTGLSIMLKAGGITMDQIKDVLDILNAPTASVEFSAEDIKQYKTALANPSQGGVATKILSNEYVKDTGAVTLLVECMDRWKTPYYNYVSYNIDKNLTNVTVGDMMTPFDNNKIVNMTAFDKNLVTNVEGQNTQMSAGNGTQVSGDTSIKYSASSKYDTKSKTTTITASALVTLTDAAGNVVGTKVVTVTQNYIGKVSASEKDDAIKKALANKVDEVLDANVTLEVEADDVNAL